LFLYCEARAASKGSRETDSYYRWKKACAILSWLLGTEVLIWWGQRASALVSVKCRDSYGVALIPMKKPN
jgi:hypothetical protein